jgi:hypothetical protein
MKLIITTILLFISLVGYGQKDLVKQGFIENNTSFTAAVEFTVRAGEYSQKLEGFYTLDDNFQYLQLDTAEFFTLNGKQIKVSNAEKKLAVFENGAVNMTNFLFDQKSLGNFYFPSKVETTEEGYKIELIPIESVKTVLGNTTVLLDKTFKIRSMFYKLPESNPFNISSLEIKYLNRIESTDTSLDPHLFFEFSDKDQLIIKKKYTNYTIIAQ